MIDFEKYYVVVKKQVPKQAQCRFEDIPSRLFRPDTVRLHTYVDQRQNCDVVLEFDGEIYWRIRLSTEKAHDGVKNVAFVMSAVRYCDLKTKVKPLNAARIVSAIMNQHAKQFVKDHGGNFTER